MAANRKLLFMGLPGAGKTTLAELVAKRLNAVHWNADTVRAEINKDLAFTHDDRIEQARRMGWLSDRVVASGGYAIADFICPTRATRAAFQAEAPATVVWLDRIEQGRFADTNRLFEPPEHYNLRVGPEGTPEFWAQMVVAMVRPVFDPHKPTALFVGRYQGFHDGHRALILKGIERVGQACVAVRCTGGIDDKNPYSFEQVKMQIEYGLRDQLGRFTVLPVPNITSILYGRDVGYSIEKIDLDHAIEAISATRLRELSG